MARGKKKTTEESKGTPEAEAVSEKKAKKAKAPKAPKTKTPKKPKTPKTVKVEEAKPIEPAVEAPERPERETPEEKVEEVVEVEAAKEEARPEKVEAEAEEEEELEIVEEKFYDLNLRRIWTAPREKRTPRAVRYLREFVARRMKTDEISISEAVNSMLWARGISKPPRKIRVRAVKDKEGRVIVFPGEGK